MTAAMDFDQYRAPLGGFDEAFDHSGQPRPNWSVVVHAVGSLEPAV